MELYKICIYETYLFEFYLNLIEKYILFNFVISRVVSAEVHSSRTRLLSSSEEDITTVKRKMSVLKSSKAQKSRKTNKATRNTMESSIDSETDTRTAAFVHKALTVGNNRLSGGNEKQNDVINFPSQRRLSGGSYTLEKPTFPLKSHQVENNETPTLPIIKTPVPLPRTKKSKENKLQEDDNVLVKNKLTEVTTKEEVANFQYKSDDVLHSRPHRYFNRHTCVDYQLYII